MHTTDQLNAALAGRYAIERQIGAGGMATVYLAEDMRHRRKVAVKVLHPELSAVLGPERFLKEIELTASLQHPHILPLFDSGTASSHPYVAGAPQGIPDASDPSGGSAFLFYVMPFVDGETLRDRLSRETQLPIDDAVRIAREVADALAYAHHHGIIHRDIKPENILLHGGHAVVADFGIALAVQQAGGQRMTQTGLSLGTPQYMAPEQAMGEKTVDARADIYALGAVTYEMLVGEPPFTGPTAQAIIARVLTSTPAPLTDSRATIPLHIEDAVLTALSKLPADRQATASAFAAELDRATTTPRARRATTAPETAPAPASRKQTATLIAVSSLAVIAIAAALWGWLRPAPSRDVAQYAIALPDGEGMASTPNFRLAISPNGRQLAYVARNASGNNQLWLRGIDELHARPVAHTEGAINPAFSPDGKRVAFVAGTRRALQVADLGGGTVVTLTDSLVDQGGVSWGYDGYIYYDAHFPGDGLGRIRESGGTAPETATRADSVQGRINHNNPSALPNGRGVLFTISNIGGPPLSEIAVLDARSGKYTRLGRGVAARYSATGHLLIVTADGKLLAEPFDADRLVVTGEPVVLTSGIRVRSANRVDLAISSGGRLVYVAGGAGALPPRELVWTDRKGVVTRVDTSFRLTIGAAVTPLVIAPDGKRVAVVMYSDGRTRGLWIKPLGSGPAVRIADVDGEWIDWSPDGKEILVSSSNGISFVSTDGGKVPERRALTGQLALAPSYSPDGQWIVGSINDDIYAMRRRDTTSQVVVGTPQVERMPRVSPDGKWLAYISDDGGSIEVYVRPFPEKNGTRRRISSSGGLRPLWSPDGQSLFFIDGNDDVNVVSIATTPTFRASAPVKLFSASASLSREYAIARDGRLLWARIIADPGQAEGLVVVENFFDDLRAKMNAKRGVATTP